MTELEDSTTTFAQPALAPEPPRAQVQAQAPSVPFVLAPDEGWFIDPDATFPITVWYEPMIDPVTRVFKGAKILPTRQTATIAKYEGRSVIELTIQATGRDAFRLSQVLEDSTVVNGVTGNPMVRITAFCRLVLLHFGKSWNAPKPLTGEWVSKVPDQALRGLVRRWLSETGGNVGSALKSAV